MSIFGSLFSSEWPQIVQSQALQATNYGSGTSLANYVLTPTPAPPPLTMREQIVRKMARIDHLERELDAARLELRDLLVLDTALTFEYGPEA